MIGVSLVLMLITADPDLGNAETKVEPRCGSNCLYVAIRLLGHPLDSLSKLEEVLGEPSPKGFTLAELSDAARHFKVETLGVETSFQNLTRRTGRFACIAHVDGGHFVLFHNAEQGKVTVVDPPRVYEVPLDTMRTRWQGKALLLANVPLAREETLNGTWPWKPIVVGAGVVAACVWFLRRQSQAPH